MNTMQIKQRESVFVPPRRFEQVAGMPTDPFLIPSTHGDSLRGRSFVHKRFSDRLLSEANARVLSPHRVRDGDHQQARHGVKILLTADDLRAGVERLARDLTRVYGESPLTIVGVMTGSVVLLADLIRLLEMPLRVGVLQASSYRGGTTRGQLTLDTGMTLDVVGRDVVIVDDIFDTGHTLLRTVDHVWSMGPRSVRSCVLLHKRGRQEVDFRCDFVGFEIPDEFVVGYGLDYQDHYRNLPYVAALEESDLARWRTHSAGTGGA